jgi:hypothetical protein
MSDDEKPTWEWRKEVEALKQQLADYQEVHEDKQRLVRKLDVIWNGEAGAATQASLCDVVAQIAKELPEIKRQLAVAQVRIQEQQREYAINAETIQALKARVQALEEA